VSEAPLNHSISATRRPRGIVWMASYPRSGMTWVRMFLRNLIDVLDRKDAADDLNAMAGFGVGDTDVAHYSAVTDGAADEADPKVIAEARPKVLRELLDRADGLLPVRTHFANVAMFGTPAIDPSVTAAGIYVVRNPLDVAVSYAAFRGMSVDDAIATMAQSGQTVATPGRRVFTLLGSWSEHVASWTATQTPALHVVRYEDLVADPVPRFKAIASHVSMTAPDEAIAEAVARCDFARIRAIEAEKGFGERPASAERFFRAGRVDQWRTGLTPAQIDTISSTHVNQMARFGYLPEIAPA